MAKKQKFPIFKLINHYFTFSSKRVSLSFSLSDLDGPKGRLRQSPELEPFLGCQETVDSNEQDVFDRLPDEIVLSIFKNLLDAKSLSLSMSVCKRFRFLAPQVHEISLSIPKKKSGAGSESDRETHRSSFRNNPVVRILTRPFQFISQLIKSKSSNGENDLDFYSSYLRNQILKPFGEVRDLHLNLPYHSSRKTKSGKSPTTFLKWKAEFGRELHNCVILGAKSLTERTGKEDATPESDPEARVIPDEELKLRIVWTISCLIAASARHYLVRDAVREQRTIENVVVTDDSNQGKVYMNKAQIKEFRDMEAKGDEVEHRCRVPALRMKMWYLEMLELPESGKVMEGATLVVIRPAAADGGAEVDAVGFGEETEGKAVEEAVRKLMAAKKCYTLEMNSF